MRIIGGTHRSRPIRPPRDDATTRPITDRVKTSLFDRLTSMAVLEGNALDLFAGTGSLGLEALSRGVEHVTFVEQDRAARQLLEANLADLGLDDRAAVLATDALALSWVHLLPHRPLNLIFLDPPYRLVQQAPGRERIVRLMERLAEVTQGGGVLCLRSDEAAAPPAVAGWEGPASHRYGSMALHFYQVPGGPEEERIPPQERPAPP